MDYLIDPEEILTIGKCPLFIPCSTFCKIKPMYGVPV
jgi:hypothetical protein